MMNFNKKKAFTLVEMLVVISVIGILSAVLLTSLGPARDKAKDTRIIQQVNQVRNIADVLYRGDYRDLEELPRAVINNPALAKLSEDIKNLGGELVIIKSKDNLKYAAYSKLNILVGDPPDLKINYYCVDSQGNVVFTIEEPNKPECPAK